MDEARFRAAEGRWWAHHDLHPTERVLSLATTGVDIRVQEVGEGPPVVLVHGASNSGVSWAPLVAGLGGFRCVAVDRPGCGLSPALREGFGDVARLTAFADAFVADVVDALGLARAAVITTSFGGYFGLRAAATHPARIERLVEIGWTFGAPMHHVPADMRLTGIPGLGQLVARLPANERIVRSMFRRIGLRQAVDAGKVHPLMVSAFTSLLRDTKTMRNELAAGPQLIRPIKGLNQDVLLPDSVLGAIEVPVAFLWGTGDPFGGAEVARPFVARIPGATLELFEGFGHAPWIDDPARIADRVRHHLTAPPPRHL